MQYLETPVTPVELLQPVDVVLTEALPDALAQCGWMITEQVFSPRLIQELYEEVSDRNDLTPASIGRADDQQRNSRVRRDKTRWLSGQSPLQAEYLARMDQIRQQLNRSLYLGLQEFEAHYARYDAGDFYRTHVDALKGQRNRVVTSVTYLNPVWQSDWGGELVLYDESGAQLRRVLPTMGTTVFFMSEEFPHEVLPAVTSRYSIAGWFRVSSGVAI